MDRHGQGFAQGPQFGVDIFGQLVTEPLVHIQILHTGADPGVLPRHIAFRAVGRQIFLAPLAGAAGVHGQDRHPVAHF